MDLKYIKLMAVINAVLLLLNLWAISFYPTISTWTLAALFINAFSISVCAYSHWSHVRLMKQFHESFK